ncbi:MAG: hypothetical protein EBQ89_07275 [Alphaproteobacteria bacterium]|nr:hypothetical protein [Alphaproteobacteria bacterium]
MVSWADALFLSHVHCMIPVGPAEVALPNDLLEDKGQKQAPMMNIGLSINARGKVYLLHDQPFASPPLWVIYDIHQRRMKIIFDNSQEYPIHWQAPDDAHQILVNLKKILIVRVLDKKPVEGFETSFIKCSHGRYIDE